MLHVFNWKVRLKSFEQQNLVIFVLLKVDRPGFDFLAESGQKTLKVGIHSQGRRQKKIPGGQQKKSKNSKKIAL